MFNKEPHVTNDDMKRRDFVKSSASGIIAYPVLGAKIIDRHTSNTNSSVPLGMDAHSLSLMQWQDRQLMEYAAGLNMDSILFNGLNYFNTLEESYLLGLRDFLKANNMRFHFGVGGLSVNSPNYSSRFGTPADLIRAGLRVARIFGAKSVNCKIGNIADRYTDGGIIASMEELINELRSMRSQIQDAGVKFAVENHAGDMRSEEVLQIVETVGTDVCGVMLDPGNAVWAMEDPMQHLEKLGKYALCSSVRDYRIWESENGAIFQWTALGEGSMNLQQYTKRMSELCPGAPLHIETVSNRHNQIPYLKEDFWEGYPDLKAADLLDFYRMVRAGKPMEVESPPEGVDELAFRQNQQKRELQKSIDYVRTHCPLVGIKKS